MERAASRHPLLPEFQNKGACNFLVKGIRLCTGRAEYRLTNGREAATLN